MTPNPDTMMIPRPDKEQIKKLYKFFGGNPRNGKMPELLEAINIGYAIAFPNGVPNGKSQAS